jgi:hypothetical protein
MIHYSCDLCGARLDGDDQRYVVKIEVYAAADDAEIGGPDDLEGIDQQIEQLTDSLNEADASQIDDANYRGFRYDLCPRCQRRYLNDPLFSAAKKRMGFSEN